MAELAEAIAWGDHQHGFDRLSQQRMTELAEVIAWGDHQHGFDRLSQQRMTELAEVIAFDRFDKLSDQP